MAITANSTPDTPSLVYRPVVFELESDDADINSLIIEVFVSTDAFVTEDRVGAFSVSPDLGTTDTFTFDIKGYLIKNSTYLLKTLGSSTVLDDADNIQYNIKAYEVLLDPVTGLLSTNYDPDNDNNLSYDYLSSNAAGFNWREGHFDLASFTKTDYQMQSVSSKFLSEAPLVKDIELGQNEFLGMAWAVSSGGSKNWDIDILTYDSSGALLNTDTIAVTQWNVFNVNELVDPYLDVPVGTQNLINAGVSLTNVAYYTIQLTNDDGVKSEIRRYNIVDGCPTDLRVHFINKFGKQDSITLKGNMIEATADRSRTYQKALGLTYDASAFGRATVRNTRTKNFSAFSKTIGRDVLEFANTMRLNNMAWIEVDGNYFSILIEDTSEVIVNEDSMPVQFRLDYSLANQEKGLLG